MKFVLPRGQKWFLIIVGAIFLLYQGYHLWTYRDITVRWKEEVLLADGSRMWIERAKITGMRPGIDRGTKADRIVIPGEKGDVVWEFPLSPMILERGKAAGQWVVIATPGYCEEHYQYGSPKPPYIQFDYIHGQWSHKHVSPEWYGKRANMLGDFEPNFEQFAERERSAFATKQIEQVNSRVFDAAKEQVVVVANYKSNCYERKLNGHAEIAKRVSFGFLFEEPSCPPPPHQTEWAAPTYRPGRHQSQALLRCLKRRHFRHDWPDMESSDRH